MEELLQCPICLEPPIGIVEQCQHGHHICAKCKPKVENCPLCKCRFEGTRNFVVEELVRHFDIIKNTMMLNSILEESSSKKKNKSKLNASATPFTPKKSIRPLPTPKCTKGLYPCRAANCDVKLPLSRLLNHVRTFHANILTEAQVDQFGNFSHTWEEMFRPGKYINEITHIFFIYGIGLLYYNIEILRTGDSIFCLQLATKCNEAQKFLATLELSNEDHNVSYKTRLISVRENVIGMLQKRLCFTVKKYTMRSVCRNKKFNTKLSISRYVDRDSESLTYQELEQVNMIAGVRLSIQMEEQTAKILQELEKENTNTQKHGQGKSKNKRNQHLNSHTETGNRNDVLNSLGKAEILFQPRVNGIVSDYHNALTQKQLASQGFTTVLVEENQPGSSGTQRQPGSRKRNKKKRRNH